MKRPDNVLAATSAGMVMPVARQTSPSGAYQIMLLRRVAMPRKLKNPVTSVTVVRMMDDD